MEFLKTYAVLVIVYGGFYLLRTNFKSAQPFLVEQVGLTTTQLGTIGFAFSLTYGFGGLILGFFIDGKNTKKVISALLLASGVTSILIGLVLAWFHSPYGWMILLWSLNGLFQAPGGPCCYSTMSRWTPRALRGRFIGWWNASHNVGAMVAGGARGGVAALGEEGGGTVRLPAGLRSPGPTGDPDGEALALEVPLSAHCGMIALRA